MSDNEAKKNEEKKNEDTNQRPNANYRLSKETANEEQLVFYYNRERRLEKAPELVRETFYGEQGGDGPRIPPRFSLLRTLTSNRSRALMFGSIVVICIAALILSALGYAGDSWELEGNRFSIQAMKYEGSTIIALRKTNKQTFLNRNETPYTGAIDIAVSPPLKSGDTQTPEEVFFHRIFVTLEEAEDYRFVVPFDADELLMVIQTEHRTRKITIKPE